MTIGRQEIRIPDELGLKPTTNVINENCNKRSWGGSKIILGSIEKLSAQYYMECCVVLKSWSLVIFLKSGQIAACYIPLLNPGNSVSPVPRSIIAASSCACSTLSIF